jgi:hypothetical protein
MSFLGGGGHSLDGTDRGLVPAPEHVELRPAVRSTRLGVGTLACPRCDAPVAIGPDPLRLGQPLGCPFCDHAAPVREFLSMRQPTRPTRVTIHVHAPRWR